MIQTEVDSKVNGVCTQLAVKLLFVGMVQSHGYNSAASDWLETLGGTFCHNRDVSVANLY